MLLAALEHTVRYFDFVKCWNNRGLREKIDKGLKAHLGLGCSTLEQAQPLLAG